MGIVRDEAELAALSAGGVEFAEQFGVWVEYCHDEMCRSFGLNPAASKAADFIRGDCS